VTEPAKVPDQPAPTYSRVEAWVFQSWLVMFLAVICCALAFYLMSFLPL
jgi:hypothetical protein